MADLSIAEQSARAVALGQYARFLLKRYQRLELIEIGETDPVSLRQIFVPMQVGLEDLRDEEVGEDAERVEDEKLPGEPAWDVLVREPFMALSGRPGSGKTTLVQAIVAELCNNELPSRLRRETRSVPVPLILRNLPDLDSVQTLRDLLDRWWLLQAEQAGLDRLPLDLPNLQPELFPEDGQAPQDYNVLLLFDGIDEVGGPALRQRLLDIAFGATRRGYRVLVTGRPTGFADLAGPDTLSDKTRGPLQLHFLLPFAWEQIVAFVDRWYRLRDEWERKRKEGMGRFLEHLADPGRGYLRSLARRPIFLTLMALVHTTQNQMPEGRPLLYKRIVDLYLERQERHRQRKLTTAGGPMPHWPEAEVRLALAHLAWQSQSIGSHVKQAQIEDARRVVWAREKMEEVLSLQIVEGPGRFAGLTVDDAPALVDYFLHPAGLLVEPEERRIQFAHLSFQEYLCAWFLHERAKVSPGGMRGYLTDELFAHLNEPGWDEVGVLLLRIRADETGQEGHFELLRWLDLAERAQAALFVTAVTGRELPFTEKERLGYLPAAVACALVHPDRDFGDALAKIPEWKEAGLALVSRLLEEESAKDAWACVEGASASEVPLSEDLKKRWLEPPDDLSWIAEYGPVEARAHSLLRLLNLSGWVEAESPLNPIADPGLAERLTAWLEALLRREPNLLWIRVRKDEADLPAATVTALEIDGLLPNQGSFWRSSTRNLPLDALVLQGEGAEEEYWFEFSQAAVTLAIHPGEPILPRAGLSIVIYQCVLLVESAAGGRALENWSRSLSLSRSRSLSLSLSRSRSLSLSRSRSRSRSRFRSR
jgi:hypothetical protein